MDSKEFIALLKDHEKVSHQSVEELKKLSLEYPYSQAVQLLYAIRLSQSSEYLFNRQLGKASILTDDRSVLFDLFEREKEEEPPRAAGTAKTVVENSPLPSGPKEKKEEEMPIAAGETQSAETREAPEEMPEPQEIPEEVEPEEVELEEEIMETKAQEPEMPASEPEAETAPAPAPAPMEPVEKPEPAAPLAADTAKYAGLSAKERIKAILEENRRLREEFDNRKTTSGEGANSEINQRIREIRENFDKVKRSEKPEEERPSEPRAAPEPQVEPETAAPETPEQPPVPVFFEANETEKEAEPVEKTEPVEEEERPQPVEDIKATEEREDESGEDPMPFEIDAEEEENTAGGPEEPAAELVDVGKETEAEAGEGHHPPPEKKAPLPTGDEKHSFGGWLQRLKEERAREGEGKPKTESPSVPIDKKLELLDSFVEKLPDLKKNRPVMPKPEKANVDMGHLQEEDGSLVTETLARVYLKQQHYQKAIKAYEILKLKYPEKSAFFADQISQIKELINSK